MILVTFYWQTISYCGLPSAIAIRKLPCSMWWLDCLLVKCRHVHLTNDVKRIDKERFMNDANETQKVEAKYLRTFQYENYYVIPFSRTLNLPQIYNVPKKNKSANLKRFYDGQVINHCSHSRHELEMQTQNLTHHLHLNS